MQFKFWVTFSTYSATLPLTHYNTVSEIFSSPEIFVIPSLIASPSTLVILNFSYLLISL
jgi:hypothetical protein